MTTSVRLRSGITLPFVEQGDPEGIPVLLLHGITDSWRSFEGVLPHLPASLHVFALSQRGHGDAERPPGAYRPADFARDVRDFMDARGLGRAVIVGHSMGSFVAQCVGMDYPERTLGLVLEGSFARLRDVPMAVELWETGFAHLEDPIDPEFVREFQASTLAQPIAPAAFEMFVSESLKVPARVWRAAMEGLLLADRSADLGRIEVPTLLVWGDRDELFGRAEQDTLLAGIPGAEIVVYRGAGHSPHWEEPARFAAEVAAFATGILMQKRSRVA